MIVKVLREKCQGHARCASFAPDIFILDDSGFVLPGDIEVSPGKEQSALRGVKSCPERALEVREN